MIKIRKKSTLGKKLVCIDDTGVITLKKGTTYSLEKYINDIAMVIIKEYPNLLFFSRRFEEVS